jgi:hypothetical protein
VLVGGIVALWLVRQGGETRIEVGLGCEGLFLFRGAHRTVLRYDDIDALRYDAPLGSSRSWLPATVLTDRHDTEWRVSALLDRGDDLISELLRLSGRDDLRAWADALRIGRRMAGASRRVGLGYGVAAAVLSVGVLFVLR